MSSLWLVYALALIYTLICHCGKGHSLSQSKINWMSTGCQRIINSQFGSLMITPLPRNHMSSPENVNVTLAHAAHPGSGIDSYCISPPPLQKQALSSQRTPTNTWHEIAVNWIVLGRMQKKKRGSEEVEENKWYWKTLVNLTMCSPTFSSLSHSTFPAWCLLLSSPVE